MADSVQTLIDEVVSFVDMTEAAALVALNRRHRSMVARARSYRKRVEIGPTVAGTARYGTGAGIVEVFAVTVDGVPFGKARREDVYAQSLGGLVWSGPSGAGFVVVDAGSDGVEGLTLVPVPDTAGLSIELFAAMMPPDLAADGAASSLHVDADFYDVLVDAAAATTLRRQGEGDPESAEARFGQACEEMRRRVTKRFSSGTPQIRVVGYNA